MKTTEIPTALVGKLLGYLESERLQAIKGLGRSRHDTEYIDTLLGELQTASEEGTDHQIDPESGAT